MKRQTLNFILVHADSSCVSIKFKANLASAPLSPLPQRTTANRMTLGTADSRNIFSIVGQMLKDFSLLGKQRRLWPSLLTALVFLVQFGLLSMYSIYTPLHRPPWIETGVTSALVFLRSSCRQFVFTARDRGTYRSPVLVTITCRGICDRLATAGLCAVVEVGVVEGKEGGRHDSPLWGPTMADRSV